MDFRDQCFSSTMSGAATVYQKTKINGSLYYIEVPTHCVDEQKKNIVNEIRC